MASPDRMREFVAKKKRVIALTSIGSAALAVAAICGDGNQDKTLTPEPTFTPRPEFTATLPPTISATATIEDFTHTPTPESTADVRIDINQENFLDYLDDDSNRFEIVSANGSEAALRRYDGEYQNILDHTTNQTITDAATLIETVGMLSADDPADRLRAEALVVALVPERLSDGEVEDLITAFGNDDQLVSKKPTQLEITAGDILVPSWVSGESCKNDYGNGTYVYNPKRLELDTIVIALPTVGGKLPPDYSAEGGPSPVGSAGRNGSLVGADFILPPVVATIC